MESEGEKKEERQKGKKKKKKKKTGKHKSPEQISDSGNKCLFYYNVKFYFFGHNSLYTQYKIH